VFHPRSPRFTLAKVRRAIRPGIFVAEKPEILWKARRADITCRS